MSGPGAALTAPARADAHRRCINMADGTCSVEGCERRVRKLGMCGSHYVIQRRREAPPCSFIGCEEPQSYRGVRLCTGHYAQQKRGQQLSPINRSRPANCTIEWCDRPNEGGGYCGAHYRRQRLGLDMDAPIRRHRPKGSTATRDDMGRKECNRCLRWLDEANFVRGRGLDGLSTKCRECNRRYTVESHGLTVAGYRDLLASQGGRCPGCGIEPPPSKPRAMAIDHDHACCPGPTSCGGCVRGVLCFGCNAALGGARDDPATLRALADYLERTAS